MPAVKHRKGRKSHRGPRGTTRGGTVNVKQAWPVRDLPIASISIDPRDKRSSHSAESIASLAANLAADGLLQAVRVQKVKGGKYILVFGRRRFLAAKSLGWKTIRAEVATLSELEAESQSAAENIQRDPLTIIEEAEEVCRILDTLADQDPPVKGDEALRAIGERWGKSETWVRDRMYFARLDGEARKLLLEGRLPLQHAREIAKLADPAEQADVARWAAREADGSGGRSITYVRSNVAAKMLSLRIIPWELEVPFAGKPACSTCPHNSANASGLFEHDKKGDIPEIKEVRPEDPGVDGGAGASPAVRAGVCLNAKCFEAKKSHASRAIKAAVTKAAKLVKGGEQRDVARGAAIAKIPDGLKQASAARAIGKELDGDTKPGKRVEVSSTPREVSPEEVAEEKARLAAEKVARDFYSQVVGKMKAKPELEFMLKLLFLSTPWSRARVWSQNKKDTPALAALIKKAVVPSLKNAMAVVEEIGLDSYDIGITSSPLFGNEDGWAVLRRLAEALGLELQDRPKAADFTKGEKS